MIRFKSRKYVYSTALVIAVLISVIWLFKSFVSAGSSFKLQMYNVNRDTIVHELDPNIKVVNTGDTPIELQYLKIRYYLTLDDKDEKDPNKFECYSNRVTDRDLVLNMVLMQDYDYYMEIGFTPAAGVILPGDSIELYVQFYHQSWKNMYNQTDDYSYNPDATEYADWTNITGHYKDETLWGNAPDKTPRPSSTPVPTATVTPEPTATATPEPTPVPKSKPFRAIIHSVRTQAFEDPQPSAAPQSNNGFVLGDYVPLVIRFTVEKNVADIVIAVDLNLKSMEYGFDTGMKLSKIRDVDGDIDLRYISASKMTEQSSTPVLLSLDRDYILEPGSTENLIIKLPGSFDKGDVVEVKYNGKITVDKNSNILNDGLYNDLRERGLFFEISSWIEGGKLEGPFSRDTVSNVDFQAEIKIEDPVIFE